jgi:hypothetical protein
MKDEVKANSLCFILHPFAFIVSNIADTSRLDDKSLPRNPRARFRTQTP